jgi:iron complex outermembrane recepter protein
MRTIYIIMALLLQLTAYSNGIISGTILDAETQEPLAGATIFIVELERGTIANLQGKFSFENLPRAEFTLEIKSIGYETKIIKTTPSLSTQDLVIQLTNSTLLIDEVVVSAAYTMSRESSPINIEKINRENLLKAPSPNLMTALSKTPGVSEISLGPGIGKPVIRGLSFSRVLSLYQGARFENQQWGADHGLGLNETGIANVEMIKGPASIIYGSGAMAGVINLIEESNASPGEITGDVNLRVFSNSLGGRSEAGIRGTSNQGLSWSLRGALESHADYLDGNGETVGNTRFNTQNLKAGMGIQKKWGDTKIRYTYLKQNLGIFDEEENEEKITSRKDRNLALPYQAVEDHFINSETNFYWGEDRLKVQIGYHLNLRKEIEETENEVDLGLRQSNFMYNLKYQKNFSKNLEGILGVQGFLLNNFNLRDAKEILIPDATKDDRSLYGLLNYNKNAWVVQGGLRYDYRKVNADASDDLFVDYGFELPNSPEDRKLERIFQGTTASLGSTFRPSKKWRFRMNLASGFRAPDLGELFSFGPHPGTSRFEVGNADFLREQNIQGDFGIRYIKNNFSILGEIFYNHVDNYIFFSPTDQTKDDLTIWKFEQDNARLYGGELGIDLHPTQLPWITFSSSLSTVIGERRSDGSYLPYIPPFRWNNEISLVKKQLGIIQNPYFSISGNYIFDQNRAAPLEESTPGYFLMGMNLGGSLDIGQKKLNIYVSGTNLLNVAYLDHMSLFRPFGIRQLGRNIALNIQYIF